MVGSAIKWLLSEIKNHVFLRIQHNDVLRREYRDEVSKHLEETVSQAIGRTVWEIVDLNSLDVGKEPKSSLIKAYTRFTKYLREHLKS